MSVSLPLDPGFEDVGTCGNGCTKFTVAFDEVVVAFVTPVPAILVDAPSLPRSGFGILNADEFIPEVTRGAFHERGVIYCSKSVSTLDGLNAEEVIREINGLEQLDAHVESCVLVCIVDFQNLSVLGVHTLSLVVVLAIVDCDLRELSQEILVGHDEGARLVLVPDTILDSGSVGIEGGGVLRHGGSIPVVTSPRIAHLNPPLHATICSEVDI